MKSFIELLNAFQSVKEIEEFAVSNYSSNASMYMTGYSSFEYALKGLYDIPDKAERLIGSEAVKSIIVFDAESGSKDAFADGWDLARVEFIISTQHALSN